MNEGARRAELGLAGWPAVAEEAIIARDVLLAERVGSRLHVCHLSTAGQRRDRPLGEVARHRASRPRSRRTTCCSPTSSRAATTPASRSTRRCAREEDVQALRDALADGTIDIVATDHAPHPLEAKECEWQEASFGMVGLESALHVVQQAVVDDRDARPGRTSRGCCRAPPPRSAARRPRRRRSRSAARRTSRSTTRPRERVRRRATCTARARTRRTSAASCPAASSRPSTAACRPSLDGALASAEEVRPWIELAVAVVDRSPSWSLVVAAARAGGWRARRDARRDLAPRRRPAGAAALRSSPTACSTSRRPAPATPLERLAIARPRLPRARRPLDSDRPASCSTSPGDRVSSRRRRIRGVGRATWTIDRVVEQTGSRAHAGRSATPTASTATSASGCQPPPCRARTPSASTLQNHASGGRIIDASRPRRARPRGRHPLRRPRLRRPRHAPSARSSSPPA